MAIFHAPHRYIGKTKHRAGTAAAHVAYITRRGAVSLVLGEHMPTDRREAHAWMLAAEAGDRANARVCDKLTLALPIELDAEQRADLVRDLMERIGGGRIAWVAGIHDRGEDAHNPHAHIVFRDRDVVAAKGKRVFGTTEKGSTERLRELWETVANEGLERAGSDARIDRRSLVDQGIDREAGIHVGPNVLAMEAKGLRPESKPQDVPMSGDRVRVIDWPMIDDGRTRADRQREIEASNDNREREREKGKDTGRATHEPPLELDQAEQRAVAWAEREADRQAERQAVTLPDPAQVIAEAERKAARMAEAQRRGWELLEAARQAEAQRQAQELLALAQQQEAERAARLAEQRAADRMANRQRRELLNRDRVIERAERAIGRAERKAERKAEAQRRGWELLEAARRAMGRGQAKPQDFGGPTLPGTMPEATQWASNEVARSAEPVKEAETARLPPPHQQDKPRNVAGEVYLGTPEERARQQEAERATRLAIEEAADLAADRRRREQQARPQRGTAENDLARVAREIARTDQATAQRMGWTPGATVTLGSEAPAWERIAAAAEQQRQAVAVVSAEVKQQEAQPHPVAIPPAAPVLPWLAETQGYEQLAEQQKRQAEAAFERWQGRKPDLAGRFDLVDYVAFVQGKEAERRAAPDRAETPRKQGPDAANDAGRSILPESREAVAASSQEAGKSYATRLLEEARQRREQGGDELRKTTKDRSRKRRRPDHRL